MSHGRSAARPVLTHQVSHDVDRGVVIKRFKSVDRYEPAREWRALCLLAEYAPGLAPAPVRADLASSPAVIEMSWLPGERLGGQRLTSRQEHALADALSQLWQSVPASKLAKLPGDSGNPAQLVRLVREVAAATGDLSDDRVVHKARADGLAWFETAVAASDGLIGGQNILGQGDANLANFLWDGQRVRLVDFEDSGLSDRAFELAVLVEHISCWNEAGMDAERLISLFDLDETERRRLADCRRLAAMYWLLLLLPGGRASTRNPPGTLRQQAERLLCLL
jgi:Ser/Thr protein kinase RdoA (MazF antagonist)